MDDAGGSVRAEGSFPLTLFTKPIAKEIVACAELPPSQTSLWSVWLVSPFSIFPTLSNLWSELNVQ